MPRNLTSADIEKQEFARSLRGYNEDEVDDFLDLVAQKLWSLEQDNRALREQVETLSARLEQYKGLEDTLNSAVLVAQQAAGELTGSARQTVGEIMQSASQAAENLTKNARETAAATLHNAEKNAAEMEARARQTSENMLADARRRAELIIQEAERESVGLREKTLRLLEKTEETHRLMEDRIRVFRSNLRGMLMSHLDLLDQEEKLEPEPAPWSELDHHGEGPGRLLPGEGADGLPGESDSEAAALQEAAAAVENSSPSTDGYEGPVGAGASPDAGPADTGGTSAEGDAAEEPGAAGGSQPREEPGSMHGGQGDEGGTPPAADSSDSHPKPPVYERSPFYREPSAGGEGPSIGR